MQGVHLLAVVSAIICFADKIMPYRKNVYIVGAGFSADAGAPVIQNFFDKAMELWKDPNSALGEEERKIFRRVFDYRKELEIAESRVQIDLDNIEDLFGVVEMACQLGIGDPQTVRKDLVYVILRTLEATLKRQSVTHQFLYNKGGARAQGSFTGDIYQFFVNAVARRWFPRPEGGIAQDSIISLNYDLLLEHAMEGFPIAPLYELPPDRTKEFATSGPGSVRIRLLKLHGSANWAVCRPCGDKIYVLKPSEASVAGQGGTLKCMTCGGSLNTRLIVPPTWNKEAYRPQLESVWKRAEQELASAQRILVIGYSMPQSDKFFQYLLALSLADNRVLDEVTVVNRNMEDGKKIAGLFKRHFERHRAWHNSTDFSRWVLQSEFQNATHQEFPSDTFGW